MHFFGQPPKRMVAAILKTQARTGDKVPETVLDTRLSPGQAVSATRAAIWAAMPPMSSRFKGLTLADQLHRLTDQDPVMPRWSV